LALSLRLRALLTVKALIAPTAFGVAGAVFDAQGRILLVRHSYLPGWHLPGGGADRGEPPAKAVMRELHEEVGLTGGEAAFVSLHTRPVGWATNVIALYRITGATVDFRPSLEIREACFANPADLPADTAASTARRLAELAGKAEVSPWW
jgi:ADP-ribose pyrophosphatase YjhB (NUDIX family)